MEDPPLGDSLNNSQIFLGVSPESVESQQISQLSKEAFKPSGKNKLPTTKKRLLASPSCLFARKDTTNCSFGQKKKTGKKKQPKPQHQPHGKFHRKAWRNTTGIGWESMPYIFKAMLSCPSLRYPTPWISTLSRLFL